ncbi:glycosyltransferase family 2 protein [Pectobacterium carotovorum]|uniref:glycosyltransferase family 2 protein n=1 Tax=Pectobacterium carotovorum TaxID=554 RepID=UPI000E733605|nr:glycosyltransferase family 2 protein [Pectobacterium carotovorum]RJL38792.1 glycosyltransferase family 2 protein [Pectobacterium carotovorum]
MNVDVVVATYNGEKYIRQQLESILQQTHHDFRVLIRDDGSSDNTVKIIKEISASDPRVFFIEDSLVSNGVGENFKKLLSHCSAEYVFLADQDDVWYRNKIELMIEFSKKHFLSNLPCIAYSPGDIVDDSLHKTGAITDKQLSIVNIKDMLYSNGGVQGCAMVINKALYTRALRYDFFWHMHDQVLSLYATIFGKIFYLSKTSFMYRQHNNNVKGFNEKNKMFLLCKYFKKNNEYMIEKNTYDLFNFFLRVERNSLSLAICNLLEEYSRIERLSKFQQLKFTLSNRVRLSRSTVKALIKLLLVKGFVEQ